jgi:uncharacterized protein YkwD
MAPELLIKTIMRPTSIVFAIGILTAQIVTGAGSSVEPSTVSAVAVVREMNLARTNPAQYAAFVDEMRAYFRGDLLVMPGRMALRTKEGIAALDEAIRFLRRAQPQRPLIISPGMCRAAADHCADQLGGRRGHDGSDRSSPGDRLSRYGTWSMHWGENVSYGKSTAREIVLALIIDDGLRGRKHRQNIFNPNFSYAGAAYGPHAVYRSVCSIEFAAGFVEHGSTRTETLVARNP